MSNFSICLYSRQGVSSRVLLRHLQPLVADEAQNLQLQAPVDPDESQCCRPYCSLQIRLQTGEIQDSAQFVI